MVEIIPVFDGLLLFALYHTRCDYGRALETDAEGVAHALVLVHHLGKDVSSTLQSILRACHLGIDVALGILFRVTIGSMKDSLGKGL